MDRVTRKKLLELAVKLGRQRLVVRKNQRRPVEMRNHVRHRERLARPRHPKQTLRPLPRLDAPHQLPNRPRLITSRLKRIM